MPNAAPGLPNPQSYDFKVPTVVVDKVTGLMWQRSVDDKVRTFAEAKAHCEALTLAGYHDWALPSRIELISLIDTLRIQPSIDITAFPQTPIDWFWTSSAAASDPESAWNVYFYFGYPGTDLMSNQFSVRCVRTAVPHPAPSAHYDVKTDTVYDRGTGLTWQRAVSDQTFGFDAARAYCSQLALGGKTGWRVPSLPELLTLVDERAGSPPVIDVAAFPNTPAEAFGTSSYFGGGPPLAWHVYFDQGRALYELQDVAYRVRCVL